MISGIYAGYHVRFEGFGDLVVSIYRGNSNVDPRKKVPLILGNPHLSFSPNHKARGGPPHFNP